MTKHQKRRALREAITDTFLGTIINWPINMIIISTAFAMELSALTTSLVCTGIFTVVAITRKMAVRVWFYKKYGDA